MAQENLNTSAPNDGLGDKLRAAFVKVQAMFTELYANKVDKDGVKVLSKNDFTDVLKTKLDGIAEFAAVNVQSDFAQADNTQPNFIKNKPAIPNVSNYVLNGGYAGTAQDIVDDLDDKEVALGNPTVNGYVLSSTIAGVRTWIAGGGVGVTDGDKGDIEVTATGLTWTIKNGVITNAKIANGAVANLSGTNTGDNATNSQYSGLQTNATHTGDVTGATALTIANSAVTYAKMQNVTTARLMGRATAGSGVMEEITLGTNLSFSGTTLNAAGTTEVVQTITASATVGNTTTILLVNPATLLATATITMPAAPTQNQILRMVFGGTITSGNPVITALTLSGSLVVNILPTDVVAGDSLVWIYIGTRWYSL